jgi:hypothetical protein
MEATKLVVEACEEDKAGVDFGINVSQTYQVWETSSKSTSLLQNYPPGFSLDIKCNSISPVH